MLVLDASGKVIIDTGNGTPRKGNFADRDFFKVQRDNSSAGLYVSAPFSRPPSQRFAKHRVKSRRVSHPDDSFAGIVLIAINLKYFQQLFAGLSLGSHGAISLIARGGLMIMRQPYDPKVVGRNISRASTFRHVQSSPEGSFSDISLIDGVRRLDYFRDFPSLSLIIMVAEAEPDIYAAWRRRAMTIGTLMAVFALGFVALSSILGAQLRRRTRAESKLQLLA